MKSKTWLLLLSLCVLALITACGASDLPEGMDEKTLKSAATDVIERLNAKDSKALSALFTEPMQKALPETALEQVYTALGEFGAFEKIEELSCGAEKNKENGESYAVVIAKAQYEKKTLIYTLSFDKDMKLAGLYFR